MTKTKLKTIFALLSGCMWVLSSCDQSDEKYPAASDELTMTCVQASWTDTRAVTNDQGQGSFSEGDRIEVLATGNQQTANIQLEYIDNKWTPSLQRADYGTGGLTLSALFPLLPQEGEDTFLRRLVLPADQRREADHTAADVLFASTTISPADASATLQFGHALHRIRIHLAGTLPDDLTVEVKSLTTGEISLADGIVTADASAGYVWMKPYREEDGSYSIIVLPQETQPFGSGEGLVRLTAGGETASYAFNATERFNAGMQTTLNLTLKPSEGSVDLDFCNQTYWVYGVTAPDFPGKENIPSKPVWQQDFEDGLWFRYSYEQSSPPLLDEVQYLTWKEGFGWFDCNKSFGYNGDGNMCWAASASNLVHWWMAQNRKYIEAYDKEYGPEYNDLPRPEKYSKMTKANQQHSEVFNFFKSSFSNQGSWETGGTNWFVNGNRSKLTYCKRPEFHGFFSHVFSTDDAIATETTNTSKENFNLWIKDAFRYNRAIGFSVYGFAGPNTGSHAMVIWGAEFDAEGNVAYVYFCDNNFGEDEPNHGSLKRFKVVYDKSNVPELKGDYAYLTSLDNTDGTPSKSRARFTSITQVDLRLDLWQKEFSEIE